MKAGTKIAGWCKQPDGHWHHRDTRSNVFLEGGGMRHSITVCHGAGHYGVPVPVEVISEIVAAANRAARKEEAKSNG